jgi:heme A synthase
MLLRTRRAFKMVIHPSILLLLLSGSYNAWMNWPKYDAMGPIGHSLFGVHLLLALVVFGILLWLLAGAEPRTGHLKWTMILLILMFLTIAAASVLKYARETHQAQTPEISRQ